MSLELDTFFSHVERYGVLGETNAEKNLLLSKATDAMASGWNTPLVVQVDDSNVFNGEKSFSRWSFV